MVQFLIHNLISKSTVNVSTFAGKLYCVIQDPSTAVPVIPLARTSTVGRTNLSITIIISNSCLVASNSIRSLKMGVVRFKHYESICSIYYYMKYTIICFRWTIVNKARKMYNNTPPLLKHVNISFTSHFPF